MPLWQLMRAMNFFFAISLPSSLYPTPLAYAASVTQSAMESVPRMDKTTERFFTSRAMKYGAYPRLPRGDVEDVPRRDSSACF